jgi:superfamily II DNA or RNA helicase
LLPFQLEPALALMQGRATRMLLADEVGLGKTVQAGLLVAELLERDPRARVLIVTPALLRGQWQVELQHKFALQPAILDAASAQQWSGQSPAGHPWALPLVITSIDYVKRPEVLRALEPLVWDLVVIDEAHHAATLSDRNAAISAIGVRARAVVMLTGTPHSGDEDAFARLCRTGDIDRQFPLTVFRRTRQGVQAGSGRRAVWLRVTPTPAEAAMYQSVAAYAGDLWRHAGQEPGRMAARLVAIVLSKRACSSAAALARSVERRLSLLTGNGAGGAQLSLPFPGATIADDEPFAELSMPGLGDTAHERWRLERLLEAARLAVRAGSGKLRALARLLRRANEPAIVFTEYRDTLADVAAALRGRTTAQLHGGLTPHEREAALREFASGRADLLLATDAAGEGLNLQQRCRLVVNLELPWTPLRLEQRVGRVDRIGQSRRVHQVHLVASGTAEESHVEPVLRSRRNRFERALEWMQSEVRTRGDGVNEQDVARALFEGGGPRVATGDLREPPLPPGVVVQPPTSDAALEAARAAGVRALAGRTLLDPPPHRWVVTSARHPARAVWAFRCDILDSDGECLWSTLFGLSHRSRVDARSLSEVRKAAADASASLSGACDQHRLRLVKEYVEADASRLASAIVRERAIARLLTDRRARLAGLLAQGALFARHPGRESAWRDEVLARALRACEEQLTRLDARSHVMSSATPAFGILTGRATDDQRPLPERHAER